MKNKKVVKITFDNEKAAEHFASWFCNSGEQYYWEWMNYREGVESGDISAIRFDYWGGTNKGKNFDWTNIKAKCGRFDRDEY